MVHAGSLFEPAPPAASGRLKNSQKCQNGAQNEQETITYIVKRAKVKSYQVLLDFTFNLVRKNKGVRVIFEEF